MVGRGGSYFLNGSRPPDLARFVAGCCGWVCWATAVTARPLVTNINTPSNEAINRTLEMFLSWIMMILLILWGLRKSRRRDSATRCTFRVGDLRLALETLGRNVVSSQVKTSIDRLC